MKLINRLKCLIKGHDGCRIISPKVFKLIADQHNVAIEQFYCKRCRKMVNKFGFLYRDTEKGV